MGELNFNVNKATINEEQLTLGSDKLKGVFKCFSGKSGEFWVSIVPSLNTSGYGMTEKEAVDDLQYNLNVFMSDLFNLSSNERKAELRKLGWSLKSKFFRKQYSASYIDENGVLQNFDSPSEVKRSTLQSA